MSTPTDSPRDATGARPDKHAYATLTEDSWFVHGGNRADDTTGAIRTPIVMANSYLLPEDPTTLDDPDYHGFVYTREHGANQRGLEHKLARLDHGESAAVFGTGMAALHAAFFTLLNPGDHAIVSNVVYIRVWGLFDSMLPKKLGVEVDFVDITDLDAVKAVIRPNTRLIHTEVIANPDLRVADITALADIAHDAGARLTVDSTFTPPPLLRPLDLGADLTLHSLTKYFNGHGDAMGGGVIGATETGRGDPDRRPAPRRRRDLAVQRLADHARLGHPAAATGTAVPELPADRRVPRFRSPHRAMWPTRVCPATRSTSAAVAQLRGGFGGVVSFAIAGTHQDRVCFVNDLQVITSAVSLGHDETLIAYEEYPEERAAAFDTPFREHGLIRLAVGLESAQDLIADLNTALTTVYGTHQ